MAKENQNTEVEKVIIEVTKENVTGKEGLNLSDFKGVDCKIESVQLRQFGEGKDVRFAFEIISSGFEYSGFDNLTGKAYVNCWRPEEEKSTPISKDSTFNFSTSSNSVASKLLKYFSVEHPLDLVGKDCEVKRVIDNNSKEKLGIYFG